MRKKPNYVFDDELYHYGIIGQKWGERRYQNEDGSWTSEGRERYGKGDSRVDKREAKIKYNTQKYKADLRSKARQDKDIRAANEERNRIKQQAKTEKLLRKEQRKITKEEQNNKKTMSNDDLKEAIEKLNLQIEYNKKLTLAKNPNSALAKADRFFEGPTGKMVSQIAANTIPDLIKQSASKLLDKKLEQKDPEKDMLEKAEKLANIRRSNAQAAQFEANAQKNLSDILKDNSNNEKITSEIIQLPRANPDNARSSDIGKTQAIETPYIGKTQAVNPAPGTPGGRRLFAWEANELNNKRKKQQGR